MQTEPGQHSDHDHDQTDDIDKLVHSSAPMKWFPPPSQPTCHAGHAGRAEAQRARRAARARLRACAPWRGRCQRRQRSARLATFVHGEATLGAPERPKLLTPLVTEVTDVTEVAPRGCFGSDASCIRCSQPSCLERGPAGGLACSWRRPVNRALSASSSPGGCRARKTSASARKRRCTR